jgi:hypothetical protein
VAGLLRSVREQAAWRNERAEMLGAPHLTRGAETGLDFVENQQHLVLVANLPDRSHEFAPLIRSFRKWDGEIPTTGKKFLRRD